MNFGWVSEALKDFTGGVQMTVAIQYEKPQDVWDMIYRAAKANSLMGCGTPGNVNTLFTTASWTFAYYSIREILLASKVMGTFNAYSITVLII